MNFLTQPQTVLGITAAISWLIAWRLAAAHWKDRTYRTWVAGLLPFLVILAILVIAHIDWRNSASGTGGERYSPLVILIYGFWMIPILLGCNLISAYFGARKR